MNCPTKYPLVKQNRSSIMKNILLYSLMALISIQLLMAQDLPPAPKRLVSDEAGILSKQQLNYLEQKLVNFNDTTSTQIAVYITYDLRGYEISDFAQRVGQEWGVGQVNKGNGVMIVLRPKTSDAKGQVWVSVGYGLEPFIPDITANHISDFEMIPRFQSNDYFGGLDAGIDVVMGLASGHFTADQYEDQNKKSGWGMLVPFIVMIIVIFMMRKSSRGSYTAGGSSLPFWTALWLGSSMGSGHGGSWSNFNSGSGGFGGGGGGFGGFGGGGFGGGGAGGSW